jgi:hypothetical protein
MRMSALSVPSALPQKADIEGQFLHVHFFRVELDWSSQHYGVGKPMLGIGSGK